jgi:hypothetical protein
MKVWKPKTAVGRIKDRVLVAIDAMSDPKFGGLPGEVFSSGLNSLKPGPLYIVGLNPGDGSRYFHIRDSVLRWDLDHFSAFIEQCWNKECYGLQKSIRCAHGRGNVPHQRGVQNIVRRALPGVDIRSVFGTNAVFAKSRNAQSFRADTGYSLEHAWDICWPVHQLFLAIVQSAVIIALGHGDSESAFSLLAKKSIHQPPQKHSVAGITAFKWTRMTFSNPNCGQLTALVIGVYHPSYLPDVADVPELGKLVALELPARVNGRRAQKTKKAVRKRSAKMRQLAFQGVCSAQDRTQGLPKVIATIVKKAFLCLVVRIIFQNRGKDSRSVALSQLL